MRIDSSINSLKILIISHCKGPLQHPSLTISIFRFCYSNINSEGFATPSPTATVPSPPAGGVVGLRRLRTATDLPVSAPMFGTDQDHSDWVARPAFRPPSRPNLARTHRNCWTPTNCLSFKDFQII